MTASAVLKVTNRAEQADYQVNQIINDIKNTVNPNTQKILAKATDNKK